MKNVIRLFLQNSIYLVAGWLVSLLLGGSPIVFVPVFLFFFFVGELLTYLVTASPLEIKKLDVLKYISIILLFTFVFRPTYNHIARSQVVEDLEMLTDFTFRISSSPMYIQINNDYYISHESSGIIDFDNICFKAGINYTNGSVVDNALIKWCVDKEMNVMALLSVLAQKPNYPKEQWFETSFGPSLNGGVRDQDIILSPIDYNPLERGEYYFYGFVLGLIIINGIILLRNSQE